MGAHRRPVRRLPAPPLERRRQKRLAWAVSGSVTGAGARGGFVVDLRWREGKPTEARIHSVGGRTTTVAYGGRSRTVTLKPGESVTLKDFAR